MADRGRFDYYFEIGGAMLAGDPEAALRALCAAGNGVAKAGFEEATLSDVELLDLLLAARGTSPFRLVVEDVRYKNAGADRLIAALKAAGLAFRCTIIDSEDTPFENVSFLPSPGAEPRLIVWAGNAEHPPLESKVICDLATQDDAQIAAALRAHAALIDLLDAPLPALSFADPLGLVPA